MGQNGHHGHQIALWAGIAAFFSTVLAIGAIDILDPHTAVQFFGAVVTGLLTGGAVYAKQRLNDAQELKSKDQNTERKGD